MLRLTFYSECFTLIFVNNLSEIDKIKLNLTEMIKMLC